MPELSTRDHSVTFTSTLIYPTMPLSLKEVSEHNTDKSCWVVIKNKVYDVTEFLPEHPGGAKIILKYAGRDATSAYEPIHPPDALEKNLPPEKHLGDLDVSSANELAAARQDRKKTEDELRMEREQANKPPLSRILNLQEMEEVARKVISSKAWAYYSSASDDEITNIENARAFTRFFFHPRVMRPVGNCDPSTTILGFKSTIPVFVSGAALAKLGHPRGEANITEGCGRTSTIQMVSSNASLSYAEIASARVSPSQPLFFQLYKHKDRALAEKRIREVESLGYNAIFLTVDAIVAGNREKDVRAGWTEEDVEAVAAEQQGKGRKGELPRKKTDMEELEFEVDTEGTAGALVANDDRNMTWNETIPWLRSVTKLPVVVKGVQCVDDAVLAAEAGVDGILLSNHGGRQLEYALPSLEVLYQIRKQRPDIFSKLEVYIDGGIRRGTDVIKALCLGATAVGLGRPFLYAQSAYGAAGVVKTIRILEREIVTAMRLIGARTVKDLVPDMVERVDWQPLAKL
ncbi:unnamed protein product [Somion occarium]|uniref:Uncharacterized protein n=1 Tax=Somion occarium TaxID=3059160 RepID=A0ABP1CPT4_9APHY